MTKGATSSPQVPCLPKQVEIYKGKKKKYKGEGEKIVSQTALLMRNTAVMKKVFQRN